LQDFQNLKEIKLTDTRFIVSPREGDKPDEIIGIVMRNELELFTKEKNSSNKK